MPSPPPSNHLPLPTHTLSNYQEALHFLESLDVSAMKLGLSRMQTLLSTLGNPQDQLPMVHIAGTNGKGSVTAMLSSVLKSAGYLTGSFTSPHLIHVRERIRINGNPILQDDFLYEVNTLKSHLETLAIPKADWPTYFEFLNMVAYQYFTRKQVDVTVFETGLGGRLDSTNIVRHPQLTVITSIGMDHTQHLGDTLAKIAAEKAGILKAGSPLVLAGNLPAEAEDCILEKATSLQIPVFHAQPQHFSILPSSCLATGLQVTNRSSQKQYTLALRAPYQKQNFATVMACIDQLRLQGYSIQEEAVQQGLIQTDWPVRFQYMPEQHLILDGSHNQDGFQSLHESLEFYFKHPEILWIVSLRANRPPDMLQRLLSQTGRPIAVIVTQTEPTHLYHPPQQLASTIQQALGSQVPVFETQSPQAALQQWRLLQAQRASTQPLTIVTGSLYTAGSILEHISR